MADPVTTTSLGDFVGLIVGGGSGVGGGALVWYLIQRKVPAAGCSSKAEETLDRMTELQERTIANQGQIIAVQQQMSDQLAHGNDAVVQVANAISGLRGFMEGRMMK